MNTTTTAPSDREGHDVPGDVSALVPLTDGGPTPDTASPPDPSEPDNPRRTRTSQARKPALFSFDGLPVRTLKIKGEPWFVTADVCAALEIANNRDAMARLADDEKGVGTADTLGGSQRVGIVNESGLYNLIFSSRRPEAQRFRRWVTGEVLPSIRKTGAYRIDHETCRVRDVFGTVTAVTRALGTARAGRVEVARSVVAQIAPDLLHLVPTAPPPAPTRAELRAEAERQKAEAQRSDRLAALDAVRQWLATHAETRLMWWHLFSSLPKAERTKAAGLRRLVGPDGHPIAPGDEGPHRVECLIFPEVFRREVCRGFDPKFVGEVLRDAGWLKHDRDRFTMKHRLPGIGNAPVFHLRPGIIEAPN
jgi:prophage antirepressor-like protein